MEIYYYLPAIILLFHIISLITDKFVKKTLFICTIIIFVIVVGFREMGFDYIYYEFYYKVFSMDNWYQLSLLYNVEFGYAYITHISPSFKSQIFVLSAVIILIQFNFIYKNTKYPFLALFFYFGMFFYTSIMGQYRQAFALSMMLLAINNIDNKKKFLFYTFIGFTFHYTALITLLILFLPRKMVKLKYYIITLAISIILAFIFPVFFKSISSISHYLESKSSFYESADYEEITGINSVMIIRAGLFFIAFIFRKELCKIPNMGFYMNIYFVSLIIYIVFSYIAALASRGSVYFSYFEFIIAANLIYAVRKKLLISFLFFVVFISLSISRQLKSQEEDNFKECFDPYKNWLIKEL